MKLSITYLDPTKLKAAKRNPRTHSEKQLEQLTAAIKEYGFTNPILVDEKHVIIAGHGRLAAATALKLKQVPVIVLKGLDEKQRRALALADNRIAMNAGWDEEMLAEELRELEGVAGLNLESLGFTEGELERLLRPATDAGADAEYKEQYVVWIDCDTEHEQTKLLERFNKEGLKCKALVT